MNPLHPNYSLQSSTSYFNTEIHAQDVNNANSQQNLNSAPVNISVAETKTMHKLEYRFRHSTHGTVKITRLKKAQQEKNVEFKIELKKGKHKTFYTKHMAVTNSDEYHHSASTFGYGEIELPLNMQNKGISYLLHYAGSDSAALLGVNKFVVDSVVSPFMERACLNSGLHNDGSVEQCFSGDPGEVKAMTRYRLIGKGWSL